MGKTIIHLANDSVSSMASGLNVSTHGCWQLRLVAWRVDRLNRTCRMLVRRNAGEVAGITTNMQLCV